MPKQLKQSKEYTEEQKDMLEDLGKAKSLVALAESEGGKLLIETLTNEIVANIDGLATLYRKIDHIELISLCALLKSRLDMLRTLTRSKDAKETIENILIDALKE